MDTEDAEIQRHCVSGSANVVTNMDVDILLTVGTDEHSTGSELTETFTQETGASQEGEMLSLDSGQCQAMDNDLLSNSPVDDFLCRISSETELEQVVEQNSRENGTESLPLVDPGLSSCSEQVSGTSSIQPDCFLVSEDVLAPENMGCVAEVAEVELQQDQGDVTLACEETDSDCIIEGVSGSEELSCWPPDSAHHDHAYCLSHESVQCNTVITSSDEICHESGIIFSFTSMQSHAYDIAAVPPFPSLITNPSIDEMCPYGQFLHDESHDVSNASLLGLAAMEPMDTTSSRASNPGSDNDCMMMHSSSYPVVEIVPRYDEDEVNVLEQSELSGHELCSTAHVGGLSTATDAQTDVAASSIAAASTSSSSHRLKKRIMEVIDVDALPEVENAVTDNAEATVVVKQEKLDEVRPVPETEKQLVSCFCPHGFSSATHGHYHCRYCGLSSRMSQNILRHEKVHKNFLADKVNARQPRYYSCRHCGFLSRYAKNLWRHEKHKHGQRQQATRALNSKQSRVPTTSIARETTSVSKHAHESRKSCTDSRRTVSRGATDSQKTSVCHCSRGFRSITGHGHFHCDECHESFRYRTALAYHKQHTVHRKTSQDSVVDNSTSSNCERKEHSRRQSPARCDSQKCDGSKGKSDNHNDGNTVKATKSSPAGSASVKTFPPFKPAGKNKMEKQSISGDGKKYATRVTINADGREIIARIQCYTGNVPIPTAFARGDKVTCPVCSKVFFRSDRLRDHYICAHNIVHSGETVYYCIPCKYKTSYGYAFRNHQKSFGHRSNVRCLVSNRKYRESQEQPTTSLIEPLSQQTAAWFYNSTARQSDGSGGTFFIKRPRNVVWFGHSNHLCSSECLCGLTTEQSGEDEIASGTVRASKTTDVRTETVLPAAASADNSKESRKLRSSDTSVQKNTTEKRSAMPAVPEAVKIADEEKEKHEPHNVKKLEKAAKMSVDNTASSPSKAITISDSDSESEGIAAVTNSQNVIQPSDSIRTRASSRVTRLSRSSTEKRKDSLPSEPETASSTSSVKMMTPKSKSPTGSRGLESLPVSRSTTASDRPSVVSVSRDNACKLSPSTDVKMSSVVTMIQQMSANRNSSTSFSTPRSVDSTLSTATSSAGLRSVPVIGVAKAVPAATVTAVTQATTMSNRSLYSLHRFSAETLWSELSRRGGMRTCDCGISFMDTTLYLLHRSCHSDLAPLKCAFCDHKAATSYDFHAHLLDHKK